MRLNNRVLSKIKKENDKNSALGQIFRKYKIKLVKVTTTDWVFNCKSHCQIFLKVKNHRIGIENTTPVLYFY